MSELIERLVEKIKEHQHFKNSDRCFVSVYRRLQCYGGPEEGGWWYDRNVLEGGVPFINKEEAEKWMENVKKEIEIENEEEQSSRNKAMTSLPDHETAYHPEGYIPRDWNDGGDLWVTVETQLGEYDDSNEPAPHYE
jgi:hypothetical protein